MKYRLPFPIRWGLVTSKWMPDSIVITDLAGELDEEGELIRGNLNRSRLLEPPSEATRKCQSISIATERILTEIKDNSGPDVAKLDKNDSRGRNRFKDTLKLILCNLFSAWSTYDHGRRAMPATLRPYIAYSRSSNAYATPKYAGLRLTYRSTIPIVDGLLALGYIENQNGFHDAATGKGRVSRMRATPRLILAMIGHGVEANHIQFDFEPVRLRCKIDGDRKGEKRSIEIPLERTRQVLSIGTRVAKIVRVLGRGVNSEVAQGERGTPLPLGESAEVVIGPFGCMVELRSNTNTQGGHDDRFQDAIDGAFAKGWRRGFFADCSGICVAVAHGS